MPLQPGSRLGHYEVLSALGAGGMGEVWRARDTRLNREVALKVLPDAFVADPERLTRFEREAKVLASLSHPHIGGIHGLEETDGVKALVLELVEGPTLADRIARGPIPIAETLRIASQIARALEAAHERGIVHRDLKPANIKVKPDGTVKVLDFGLAKALEPQLAAAQGDLSQSPTLSLTAAATRVGVLLGTAAYMAPEQARGRPVDKRTDIWAFACVVYEMLAGRSAFAGADLSETLARVLERDPDWTALPCSTPPGVLRVLRRCLRRDLEDRLHDIADVRIELEEAGHANEPEAAARMPGSRRLLVGAAIVAGVVVIAAAVGLATARWADSGRPPPPVWFSILPPHGSRTAFPSPPALSPDGRQIAFSAPDQSGNRVLWVRAFESPVSRSIPGSQGASSPFWSPDGESLAFFDRFGLNRVDLAGGSPQKIDNSLSGWRSGTWNRTGDVLFFSLGAAVLNRVAATGGPLTPVTALSDERHEVAHMYPHFLPDGRRFLYFSLSLDERYEGLYVGSLDGGDPTFVAPLQSRAEYADGHLIFGRGSELFAQPFDLDSLKLTGEPSRIGEGVGLGWGSFHNFAFTTAPGGAVAYRSGSWPLRSQLVLMDSAGRVIRNLGEPDRWYSMTLSPDGKRLALERINGDEKNADVWIMDLSRARLERLTFDRGPYRTFAIPVWSSDSERLLATNYTGPFWVMSTERSGDPGERLPHQLQDPWGTPTDWSPDGQYVVVNQTSFSTSFDIWLLPTSPAGEPAPYAQTPYREYQGRVSPDGNWLVYTSDEAGREQIYLDTFPHPTRKILVSSSGGDFARWSNDGRTVFYLGPDRTVMRANVSFEGNGARASVSDPEPLFRLPSSIANPLQIVRSPYEVLDDGEQFVFNLEVESQEVEEITVVLNWPESLKP